MSTTPSGWTVWFFFGITKALLAYPKLWRLPHWQSMKPKPTRTP
jgi:hypothetical protein